MAPALRAPWLTWYQLPKSSARSYFSWPLEVWVDHLFLFVPQVQSQKVAAQSSRRVRGQGIALWMDMDGHNLRHALFLFINGFSLGEPSHSIKWGAKEPQEPPRSRGSCSSTECSWLFLVSAPDKLMFTCALRAESNSHRTRLGLERGTCDIRLGLKEPLVTKLTTKSLCLNLNHGGAFDQTHTRRGL